MIIDPTTTVTNSDDTYLQDATNFGSNMSLVIGKSSGTNKKRTIIRFNIGSVPSNATVLNAQLKLRYYGTSGSTWIDRWEQAHQLLMSWDEMQATRDVRLTGTNWALQYGAINGTDAKATMESTLLFKINEYPNWKSWDLTSLTQQWVNLTASNYGVILWATNEDTDGINLFFRSSEYTTDPTMQPKLEIIWSQLPRTVYFLKDHLGSIRASVQDTTTAPVVGYDDYDPWGYILAGRSVVASGWSSQAGIIKNKFTGKEWDDEFGLNWNYFGARYYDPLIGRWMVIDPLWQKHPNVTPYNYVLNNPLILIDPDGKQIRFGQAPAGSFLFMGMASGHIKETLTYAGATLLAGAAILGGAEALPYVTAAALSNPVTTNEIGIAITEALAPGAESFLNAPSAIKGLTKGDLQRVFIGGESKAGRFTEALHNKPLTEGGAKVESLKSMKDGKFVFVKKLENGSYEITVQTRAGGKTVDTQTTKGTAKELGLPNLDELYEQGAANHFIGKTKED